MSDFGVLESQGNGLVGPFSAENKFSAKACNVTRQRIDAHRSQPTGLELRYAALGDAHLGCNLPLGQIALLARLGKVVCIDLGLSNTTSLIAHLLGDTALDSMLVNVHRSLQLSQMLAIPSLRQGNGGSVPSIPFLAAFLSGRLVAGEKHDRMSFRIEGKQNADFRSPG